MAASTESEPKPIWTIWKDTEGTLNLIRGIIDGGKAVSTTHPSGKVWEGEEIDQLRETLKTKVESLGYKVRMVLFWHIDRNARIVYNTNNLLIIPFNPTTIIPESRARPYTVEPGYFTHVKTQVKLRSISEKGADVILIPLQSDDGNTGEGS